VWELKSYHGRIYRGLRKPPPIAQEIFAASIYSLASAVDSDCSRTARGHCYGSTRQLQQRQVSKYLLTADHPRSAARNNVRVWAHLQVAARADIHPFYRDRGSTRGASFAAVLLRALSYARQRARHIC